MCHHEPPMKEFNGEIITYRYISSYSFFVYLTHYHLRARKHNKTLGFVAQFFGFVVASDKTKSFGVQSFVGLFRRFVVSDDKTKSWVRRCVSTFRRETDLQGPAETSLPLQALRASLALQGPPLVSLRLTFRIVTPSPGEISSPNKIKSEKESTRIVQNIAINPRKK